MRIQILFDVYHSDTRTNKTTYILRYFYIAQGKKGGDCFMHLGDTSGIRNQSRSFYLLLNSLSFLRGFIYDGPKRFDRLDDPFYRIHQIHYEGL